VYDLASAIPTTPVLTLTNPAPGISNYFGYAVAVSGSRVVVGAYSDDLGATNAGRVWMYDLASATPLAPLTVLTNPSPAVGDNFGWAVAIDGMTVAVGAPFDDTSATDRGAAYVFGFPRPTLHITSAPGLATLSWTPTNSPGFVLQYTDSLASANWLPAPSGAMNR